MWCARLDRSRKEPSMNVHATAPVYPYILFNKSPSQLRLIGARGGKTHGRNQRARRILMTTQPEAAPQRVAPGQTTAQAVAALDAQFPWLRCAEKRRSPRQTSTRLKCTDRGARGSRNKFE